MRIGSLFSGIGAMDRACEQHFRARTVWHVERDAYCRSILARHWPDAARFNDVTTVGAATLEPVDILIGGPPCVDLSAAGRRKGLHADRSGLFFELVRIAAELKPALVVVENVPALLRDWRGTVESAMAGAGYGVTWALMTARHAGAPHLRWRVVLLCRRGGRQDGGQMSTDPWLHDARNRREWALRDRGGSTVGRRLWLHIMARWLGHAVGVAICLGAMLAALWVATTALDGAHAWLCAGVER